MRKPNKVENNRISAIDEFIKSADGGSDVKLDNKPIGLKDTGLKKNLKRHTVQLRIDEYRHLRMYCIRKNIKKLGKSWSVTDALLVALDNEIEAMEKEIERILTKSHDNSHV